MDGDITNARKRKRVQLSIQKKDDEGTNGPTAN
jgi:hypothetical protein